MEKVKKSKRIKQDSMLLALTQHMTGCDAFCDHTLEGLCLA